MCLAVPRTFGRQARCDTALVDLEGVQKEISLEGVYGVQVGDYVILHVGYALTRLDSGRGGADARLVRGTRGHEIH